MVTTATSDREILTIINFLEHMLRSNIFSPGINKSNKRFFWSYRMWRVTVRFWFNFIIFFKRTMWCVVVVHAYRLVWNSEHTHWIFSCHAYITTLFNSNSSNDPVTAFQYMFLCLLLIFRSLDWRFVCKNKS